MLFAQYESFQLNLQQLWSVFIFCNTLSPSIDPAAITAIFCLYTSDVLNDKSYCCHGNPGPFRQVLQPAQGQSRSLSSLEIVLSNIISTSSIQQPLWPFRTAWCIGSAVQLYTFFCPICLFCLNNPLERIKVGVFTLSNSLVFRQRF